MQNLQSSLDKNFPVEFSVVFLHAHPDDESFLSGGLIQLLRRKGRQVFIIYCAAAIVTGESKTITRQSEAQAATGIYNINAPLFMDFCEPQYLSKEPAPFSVSKTETTVEELYKIIEGVRGGSKITLVSYDKNGGYGNIDHKKVHELGREFTKKYRFIVNRLFEVTINMDRSALWLKQNSNQPQNYLPEIKYWNQYYGSLESKIRFSYELTPEETEKKKEGLCIHKSQLDSKKFPLTLKELDFKYWFGTEYLNEAENKMYFAGERKFIVKNLPNISNLPRRKIIQGYLPESTDDRQIRLRQCDDQYWYTETEGRGQNKYSHDRLINEEEFNDLWPQTQNQKIEKIRYSIYYGQQHIDLDVFLGNLEGLIMAEVEGLDIGYSIDIPDWFDSEVTNDPTYSNYNLSKINELTPLLETL